MGSSYSTIFPAFYHFFEHSIPDDLDFISNPEQAAVNPSSREFLQGVAPSLNYRAALLHFWGTSHTVKEALGK